MIELSRAIVDQIREEAARFGFGRISFTTPALSPLEASRYSAWVEAGRAADMGYMMRDSQRRTSAEHLFPGVRSVMALAVGYHQGPRPPKPGSGSGRVARYAWGADYHEVITNHLQSFLKILTGKFRGHLTFTIAVDTRPLMERALASQAGLGKIGKNTTLIAVRASDEAMTQRLMGSWLFLAEVLTNMPLLEDPQSHDTTDICGNCTQCLTACPTQALTEPYVLDARRCISYHTNENRGWIPRDLLPAFGDWIFGCDICQDVCPHNTRVPKTSWPEFESDQGAGPWISLERILSLSTDEEFKTLFGTTPLKRVRRRGLVRNALVAAGNSGDKGLIKAVERRLYDSDPVIRGHAVWALRRLKGLESAAVLSQLLRDEKDPQVLQEINTSLGV